MILSGTLVVGSGCTKDPETNPADSVSQDALKSSIVLTDAEIESLNYMVEEEKLALDVDNHLYGICGLQIHEKIAASELKHVTTMSKFF